MRSVGLKYAFGTQLRLLNAVFIAIVSAPIIALGFRSIQQSGIARDININLSDKVVSYYLNGGLQMKASDFETLILSREAFTLNVLSGDGVIAQAAILAFLAGLAVGLFRLVSSVVSLIRIVRNSYHWHGLGRVRLRLSDRTLVPFSTRGFRNYYVVIPSHMLTESEELKVALAHEFQHIRQGDLEWEISLELLKPFFFLNPAYRAWKRQVEHLRELNCDRKVLLRGRVDARAYCQTLLSVCQKSLRRDRAFAIAVPKVTLVTADRASIFSRKQSFLEQRVRSVIDAKRPSHNGYTFFLILVPLLVAMTMTILAIQAPGDWSQDRLMLSTVVNLERLDEINRLSTFGRVRN